MEEETLLLCVRSGVPVIALCFLLTSCATMHGVPKNDRYFLAVLDAQMEGEGTGEYHTMDRLFDLKNSSNPEASLIGLLDYYLGEAGGVTLAEFLSEAGERVLPRLVAKRAKPIECQPQYAAICMESVETRNERIDWIANAIRKGVILRAEDPAAK